MKILYAIAEHYPTFRADVSTLFGKYLPREEVYTDLVALEAQGQSLIPWRGGRVHSLPGSSRRAKKHLQSIRSDLRLLRLAGKGYDAVQVRDKTFCALVGLLAARAYGIPFYYWMSFPTAEAWCAFARERGSSVGMLRWGWAWLRGLSLHILLYRFILPRADHVFVQSDRMRDKLLAKGIHSNRMTPVPMGVDCEALDRITHANLDGNDRFERPTFVYLGALDRNRRPEIMIDAIDLVRRQVPEVQLLLIGGADEATDRAWLTHLVAERELSDHVHMTGWLPTAEGWALARRCLAGLSPVPRGELFDVGSPTKTMEYLGLGLPVIANDQPDQELVLSGAGASCVPLSGEAFAAHMLDIIAAPERYRKQAAAGANWVRLNRSYALLAAKVAHVYNTTKKYAVDARCPPQADKARRPG